MAAGNTKEREIDFFKMKYAVKFRAIIKEEEISAYRLAQMMGLDRVRISRIINGRISPTLQDIETLKKVFPDIDLNDFLGDGFRISLKVKKASV